MADEKNVERAVCRWAKKHDIWPWKLTVVGWSGMPDRLFIFPDQTLVFIEFKAQGKKARPLQIWGQRMLQNRGFEAHIMDNKEDAIAVLNAHL